MTRFARAKGSKASNERMPNEPTPWHVMKQQLEDNVASRSFPPERTKTAKQLLDEKDELFYCDTTGNVNNDWAEFERPKVQKTDKSTVHDKKKSSSTPISKKKNREVEGEALENGNDSVRNSFNGDMEINTKVKSKKRDSKNAFAETAAIVEDSKRVEVDDEEHVCEIASKKKAKKRKSQASNSETVKIAENSTNNEATPKNILKKQKSNLIAVESAENLVIDDSVPEGSNESKKKSKKRKSDAEPQQIAEAAAKPAENVDKVDEAATQPKNKKKKKNKKAQTSTTESTKVVDSQPKENDEEGDEEISKSKETTGKMSKRQKRNQKRKNKIASAATQSNGISIEESVKVTNSGTFDAAGNEWSSNVDFGKKIGNKSNDSATKNREREENNSKKSSNNLDGPANNATKRKPAKIRDDKEHKRRKPDVGSIKCTINGMDVEIVKYDGFPVKKEDAERLKDLRKQMILKGIPKSEINAAMKLERRKAEKSLARMRKQVCFHCRKAGHNLSECPELGEGETATGICFKCGSTEHTHFDCKVMKKQEYGFASCFICREQGHIAKQCPDNPKGLYPDGGSCKICGDVTHLRKDCPDLTKEKEENSMTLGTIETNTLEALDEEITTRVEKDEKKTQGKIVKF